MAVAAQGVDGSFSAQQSLQVDDAGQLLAQLRSVAPADVCVFVGFDFPIGVPAAYASKAGILSFRSFLLELAVDERAEFFEVATKREEISLDRPFYPNKPGGCKQAHLLEALGVSKLDDLRRTCDLASPDRPAACPLFWTLGGKQVGKAALAGWREVLMPEFRHDEPGVLIWPFDGKLEDLLKRGGITVAETYPAEFYGHLGITFPPSRAGRKSGKRVQNDRAALAPTLMSWASRHHVEVRPELREEIEAGFGDRPDGEDRFDAVVGLFGMLNVALGHRSPGPPEGDLLAQAIEGWILGMEPIR